MLFHKFANLTHILNQNENSLTSGFGVVTSKTNRKIQMPETFNDEQVLEHWIELAKKAPDGFWRTHEKLLAALATWAPLIFQDLLKKGD
jgi:hypothetical protein